MSIEEICKKYGIENYTINDDNSIDVDGYVDLQAYHIKELPLTFNKVTGNFDCSDNKLTDLKGSPKSVGGGFDCGYNKLTSLSGGPEKIVGDFFCESNYLTSLEGGPESVGYDYDCASNKLTSLEGSPKSIGGYFYCHTNPIGSIFNNVDIDFIRAFKTYKVLNDGVVNLKRLKYITEMFDKYIDIEEIEKHYTIK